MVNYYFKFICSYSSKIQISPAALKAAAGSMPGLKFALRAAQRHMLADRIMRKLSVVLSQHNVCEYLPTLFPLNFLATARKNRCVRGLAPADVGKMSGVNEQF